MTIAEQRRMMEDLPDYACKMKRYDQEQCEMHDGYVTGGKRP